MSSIQRRFGLLLGAALLTMAFAAPSAFATVDFPHQEEASKWTGVAVYDYNGGASVPCDEGKAGGADCSYNDSGARKYFQFGIALSCTGSWSGDVGSEGQFTVTSQTCMPFQGAEGRICQHSQTREYWLRLAIGSAVSFAHLTANASGLATKTPTHHPFGVVFGTPSDNIYTFMNNGTAAHHVAFNGMWSSQELLIGAGPGEGAETAPCEWPEL